VCPDSPPANGTSCACLEGLSCNYDTCAAGQAYVRAACTNAHWSVSEQSCSDPCDDVLCLPGTFCMATHSTSRNEWSYDCAVPVCAIGAERCQCISDECTGKGGDCRELSSGGVLCTVP
jgi:hypothetical protein